MLFDRKYKTPINHKKVRRIKRDLSLFTTIRRKSKFRAIYTKGQEHCAVPNLVGRKFSNPNLILVDITEMRIANGQKSFVFAMKNALTREIVGLEVSSRPTMELARKPVERFLKANRGEFLFHSDQGTHFTVQSFRSLLKNHGVRQSMSRKGNCHDNAPIESFFGHLKDEIDYRHCQNVKELEKTLRKYVDYYNLQRPQWDLDRKTPAEARVALGLVY